MGHFITPVVMKYQADWAKLEVISPGASIIDDNLAGAGDRANVTWTDTSVLWQKPGSERFSAGILQFEIVNDGGPVDIVMSCGRDGFRFADCRGGVEVSFEQNIYRSTPTDWNEKLGIVQKTVTHCPVTRIATDRAYIDASQAGDVISKYTLQWSWTDSRSGIPIPFTFNINSDIPLPAFKTDRGPNESQLDIRYVPSRGQPNGLSTFNGVIGNGRIYLEIPSWGIVVEGSIVGGPKAGTKFVGSGNWTTA
ncbi:hypothetical protein FRC12_005732 [Ceratobasidium sp. 428]|nr:hypothetical protein FRC12_005732 [Ceratobasidium sp. 428]